MAKFRDCDKIESLAAADEGRSLPLRGAGQNNSNGATAVVALVGIFAFIGVTSGAATSSFVVGEKPFGVGANLGDDSAPIVHGMIAAKAAPAAKPPQAAPVQSASYTTMAPLDRYLMDRDAEITLARSAAPPALSRDATILVLNAKGYETAASGKNGFTCLVERGWMSPFDHPDFWDPKLHGPVCYNAAAVRTVLPYTVERTRLVLAGLSKAAVHQHIEADVARKALVPPAPGAMSYMMSKDQFLSEDGGHWHPHVMFHIPRTDPAGWGANLAGSPIVQDSDHTDVPEPQTIFMLPVEHWSDGTSVHAGMG